MGKHLRRRIYSAAAVLLQLCMAVSAFAVFPIPAFAVTCDNTGTVTNFVDNGAGRCIGSITTTGAGTITLPSNWTTTNTIEVIGGGGGGDAAVTGGKTSSRHGGGGGGGGAYSTVSNITVSNGASYSVGTGGGAAGVGGDTWFNGTSCAAASACAKGGTGASGATNGIGGGQTGNTGNVGTAKLGGNGGAAGSGGNTGSAGGGGAAGSTGNGNNGTTATTADTNGGSGDAGSGGTAGTASGGVGGNGNEWSLLTAGSGGGGAGNTAGTGGGGGNYGGGGGGGATGGSGIQGIIVITYTPLTVSAPTITSSAATSITTNSATLNGNITATGGASLTVRGFAWGTVSNLSGGDTATTTDTVGQPFGTGAFTGSLSTLSPNTTYYFRAYGTNSGGTGYSSPILSFTTSSSGSIPTVTTDFTGNISDTSAVLFATIVADGGASITQHGFATSTDPTMATNVSTTTLGSGSVGQFSGTVLVSSQSTTYYYRAYAVNSVGTSYGSVRSFLSGNTTVTRRIRLFAGFRMKFYSGKIKLFGL